MLIILLLNRYEQGLEDYEEAVARVDKIKEAQRKQVYGGLDTLLSLVSTAGEVWSKVSNESRMAKNRKYLTTAFIETNGTVSDEMSTEKQYDTNGNNYMCLTSQFYDRFLLSCAQFQIVQFEICSIFRIFMIVLQDSLIYT